MYKERHIHEKLVQLVQDFRIILITGPRGIGKKTLLKHAFPEARMIVFEADKDIKDARKDPASFLKYQHGPLILADIHYTPSLLPAIKERLHSNPHAGPYFLTTAYDLGLLKGMPADVTQGIGVIRLDGMTTYEHAGISASRSWLATYLKQPHLLPQHVTGTTGQSAPAAIWRGGMPEACTLQPILMESFFSGYVKQYINNDVQALTHKMCFNDFWPFFTTLAPKTATETNYAQVSKELAIANRTAYNWLHFLTASYQWLELPAYHQDRHDKDPEHKHYLKTKGHIKDVGLACYLSAIAHRDLLAADPRLPLFFETLVINTIVALLPTVSDQATCFYWHASNGGGVSLLICHNQMLYPIHVVLKEELAPEDEHALQELRRKWEGTLALQTGLIVYAGTACYQVSEHTIAVPWNGVCEG